jgi:hypothetical protein
MKNSWIPIIEEFWHCAPHRVHRGKDEIGCVYLVLYIFGGDFFNFFSSYYIQHCFICRPSDSTVLTDAGIEHRTVATSALAVRRSNHLARSHPGMYLPAQLERTLQFCAVMVTIVKGGGRAPHPLQPGLIFPL